MENRSLTIGEYVRVNYFFGKRKIAIWPLAVLMISFFYCLPLGRFSIGGFDSDFRIFDFAILFVFIYYLSRQQVSRELSLLFNTKKWFIRWLKILSILVILSIVTSMLYSGLSFILPTLIRVYRFISYLLVPFLIFAVVRRKEDYYFLFNLFFWLIAIIGTIAFFQGLGLLPNFWPDYWRAMYSENDAPVATLSPHHKHIGVIMLVGVCIGIGYLLRERSIFIRLLVAAACLIMFTVPLFAGTRTYLLGFVGVIPALIYVGRIQVIISITILVLSALVFLQYTGDRVSARVESKFNERVTSRVNKLGYEGLYIERTIIYEDIFRTIIDKPYLLLSGTGYQNIFRFIGANGAHNNYLQALMELGILGFVVFITFLHYLWKNLRASSKVKDRDISINAQYTWVALCGLLMTMFVGETYWGQAAMFTLAGQLSFLFGLAVSPLYWIGRFESQFAHRLYLQNKDNGLLSNKSLSIN